MRYYSFVLNTSADKIEKNSTIRLKDYDYDNIICGMNVYLYHKLMNGIGFLTYREDKADALHSVFSYDESKYTYSEAFDSIMGMLGSTFRIRRLKEDPVEITGEKFYECIMEGKRREYAKNYYRFVESAGLRLYDEYFKESVRDSVKYFKYSLLEKIVPYGKCEASSMYDDSLKKELANLQVRKKTVSYKGNVAHYVISGRSPAATRDIAETLVGQLYAANRLNTRRIAYINDIDPDVFRGNSHLEELIENNLGGCIVIDLTERFGSDPVAYGMASQYLEELVKRYRNDCLFIFTYNIDKPGFSYMLLSKINRYVLPVKLREGSGDRKAAVSYMQNLIKLSDYSKYANQAEEYMARFKKDRFSQTDVLHAYEQFEPWCVNKNILKSYDYDISDDFLMDRDENEASALDKLNSMIGLGIVKEKIAEIIAADQVEKERKNRMGISCNTGTMHMVFAGNPGSAKTTVAKLFAGVAKEKGILKSGIFVERSGVELDGMLAVYNIRNAFEAAVGGVLFIDEAYAISSDTAVTALIQEMENRREEVIVVLAGYNGRMKKFMELNEGLVSRVPYWIDFPDYDEDELTSIFKLMLKERGLYATPDAIKEAHYILEKMRYMENFGNGRYVRNLIDRAVQKQSVRLLDEKGDLSLIPEDELLLITRADICDLEEGLKDVREPGTALKELDEMIGLGNVKSVIKKAVSSFKLRKLCLERGIRKDKASMHMVFTGNPGTAKTTVARLFAEILKDENVLPMGTFLECGRADLVGDHVGATAIKVKKKFREAQGGVLFIDEAYSLCDGYKNGYGDEAINTIVQEMENHREDVIVIFAGYPDQMQQFLDRNPGLTSRVAFRVEFDDYLIDELMSITRLMVSKKDMTITEDAMNKLKGIYELASKNSDYGNGRFVRKLLEEAEMNLAQRLYGLDESDLTEALLSTIEECDIPESYNNNSHKKPIGFCVA